MTTINLKDFYYWYLTDELVEVPDEVAEELMASKRREAAHAERVRYAGAAVSVVPVCSCYPGSPAPPPVDEQTHSSLLKHKRRWASFPAALSVILQ